jgi:hypothetical protein
MKIEKRKFGAIKSAKLTAEQMAALKQYWAQPESNQQQGG